MTPKQWHRHSISIISANIKNITPNETCFIECGVKQGTSSIIMAKVLGRQGYLFDTWTGFPSFSDVDAINKKRKAKLNRRVSKTKSIFKVCKNNLKKNNVNETCSMIQGDILQTIPEFITKNVDSKLCMVHIDTDLYEPTKLCLESLHEMLDENGCFVVHDYRSKVWPGVTKAVDDYCLKNKGRIVSIGQCDLAVIGKRCLEVVHGI